MDSSATPQGGAGIIPILLYHDVADEPRDVYALTPADFRRHMDLVAASGRRPMTVDELVDALPDGLPERPVLVTFDDGYRDFDVAVDAMAAAGVDAATLYVTTGQAGTPGMIAWSQLADLPAWVQVGAHSRTHPQLDVLPAARLREEVVGSKDDLEQRLGRPCSSFAYPHGHHGGRVRRAVVDAGYTSAAAVKNALSHPQDDPYSLGRVTVTRDTTDADLVALLDGRGAPLSWRRERLRTKGFRAYRRLRRGSARV